MHFPARKGGWPVFPGRSPVVKVLYKLAPLLFEGRLPQPSRPKAVSNFSPFRTLGATAPSTLTPVRACPSQILVLLCTVLAVAVEFELVVHDVKSVFFFDFFLDLIKEVIGEFRHLAAAKADEMMVGVGQVMVV